MRRTLTAAFAFASLAAIVAVPAQAAPAKPKPKPKPITGSYTVNLPPDPTKDATSTAGEDGCSGLLPQSKHSRPFTLPAAGKLVVNLVSANPLGEQPPAGLDWDLYLMRDGASDAKGTSPLGSEMAELKVKKKTSITIDVCNLNGFPDAKVTYTFTYQ